MAEVESLYGPDKLQAVGEQAVIVDVDPCLLAFSRLGGSTKFAKVLTILDTTNWGKIEKFLLQVSPGHSQTMPPGKMTLGLSLYGFNESSQRVQATGLSLKKAIRKTDRSVRLVPNKAPELNTAQVLHNNLAGPNGWELLFIKNGEQTVVAQTVKVQDIESYTRRDRERPKRDAKVGMLPPKLAQILINLASGPIAETSLQNICDIPAGTPIPHTILGQTVLDPFCGTGVVLQEAHLMGYDVFGTDLEPRMIEYTRDNLNWLEAWDGCEATQEVTLCDVPVAEVGDATSYQWQPPIDLVASETYLGRPFTAQPSGEILAQTTSECNTIIKKFLQNIGQQLKPGTRLCLAVPAWQIKPNQFKHLPLIDQIEDLGYNRISFEHLGNDQLIYYRSDQIVARQLLVIVKK